MSILLVRNDNNYKPWLKAFAKHPEAPVIVTPQTQHNPEDIKMILTWKAPAGSFTAYPQVPAIGSLGAGVDHLFDDPSLPKDAVITRVVNDKLSGDMQEFVLAHCLNHIKNLNIYATTQNQWNPLPYKRVSDIRVGILGLGTLGQAVGGLLNKVGFTVMGWSQHKKNIATIKSYTTTELDLFLSQADILVCLLPLTEATRGILDKELFYKLPQGAYLINVARGAHLNEEDLIEAINNEHLSGAALDVFDQEPLPVDHVLRKFSKILITPHVASVSNPESVVPQIIENYKRLIAGKALLNVVSREQQY